MNNYKNVSIEQIMVYFENGFIANCNGNKQLVNFTGEDK